MLNRKILALILLPMLLAPLMSFSYAHVTSFVVKKYKLHIQFSYLDIESYKIYSPWNDDNITDQLFGDTLYINTTIFPSWHAWVGLVIKNNGIFNMKLEEPTYQIIMTPEDSATWNTNEFYYGPYTEAGFNPLVWGDITGDNYQDKLDPDEGVIGVESEDPPVYLEPPPASRNKCKLIMWIYLHIEDGPDDFIMELSIIITGIMTDISWVEEP